MRSRLEKWRHAVASLDGPSRAPTRHVLLTLALYMNPDGRKAWPSYDTLAAASALSRRAVITHINFAVDEGWLIRRSRSRVGKGWPSNDYEIAIPQRYSEQNARRAPIAVEQNASRSEQSEEQSSKVVTEVHTIKPIDQTSDQMHRKTTSLTLGKTQAEIAEGREYLRALREQSRRTAINQ